LENTMFVSQKTGVHAPEQAGRLYRTLWRWHFYAGLFFIPFIIILSLSGATYLFKTQIEAALDAPFNRLTLTAPPQPVSLQVRAAIEAVPASALKSYRLPQNNNDAAQITVTTPNKDIVVFVRPDTLNILKIVPTQDRFMAIVASLHGELLMGDRGSLIVELAASWALVMVVTGAYLWWPRTHFGLAGVLWPRLGAGSKIMWRDLHAVTGIWVSGFAVILILTGLPWTNVWGDAFTAVRKATGTSAISQDWSQSRTRQHADMEHGNDHNSASHADLMASGVYRATIDDVVASARTARLQPPVVIFPPSKNKPEWRAMSQTQNRPLGSTLTFDPNDGRLIGRTEFSGKHPIDQVVGVGLAVHEGALFGVLNQIIGLLTALGLVLLFVSAFLMWRKRAPEGVLGAPPVIPDPRIGYGLAAIIVGFAVFLPVLGMSLLAIGVFERLVLTQFRGARRWLGLSPLSEKGAN
jgi:uncharacterized iron-regulated membrane protein